MQPIVEELSHCAITYDRLGRWIASDLGIPWPLSEPPSAPTELLESCEQIYKELRLFFNRANRGRTLRGGAASGAGLDDSDIRRAAVNQNIGSLGGSAFAVNIDEIRSEQDEFADLPDLIQVAFEQNIGSIIPGGSSRGVHVGRITPGRFQGTEVVSLTGSANVGSCEDGAIEGVIIDTISAWNGVRIRFDLVVGELTRARVVGISASAPPGAIEQPAHVTIT